MSDKVYTYRATKEQIERLEVVKETDKQITVIEKAWDGAMRESRIAKHSNYYSHFKTFAEAKAYLVDCARKSLAGAHQSVDRARSKLQEAEQLKETSATQEEAK